ncbi:phosphodiester glycosidase family protein, partial [Streptomyces sp. NPDC127079]
MLAGAALTAAAPAGAVSGAGRISSGITYRQFDVPAARGTAHAHVLTVDLTDPHVRVDLLTPGAVAARARVSAMADAAGAVAGVNGDFFDITETQHPGVEATGASVGPAIGHRQGGKTAGPPAPTVGHTRPPGPPTPPRVGGG